ncbi:hypothetical protein chiPu_0012455 [Chiloscyllium punctatum]|uniref:Cytochrome P450 n=1 Tax=Chiloscyllium punctatum TaxID=137246 RepID=A0A401SUC0_CHIPU|nr:hypothetical protein [Chiloscyllium punctatum]
MEKSACLRQQVQKGRFPPGPPALPLLGNLFHVNVKAPHKSLIKLSEQYGPVYTVWFGTYPAVVLCGFDTIKEALIERGHDFGSRYPLPLLHKASEGYGVIASSGERWKQLRRFSLSTLRNFGMGKKSIEERIQEEAQFLVKAFREKKETPFNPDFLMRCAASNIICSIVFGDRFEYGDKEFLSLLEMIADNGRILSGPWVQKIHQEIDEVIGSSRCPTIEDRTKMPYTDAVIHEVQRYADLIPMNLPHMASNDIEFRGYLIPKGTFVIPVLSSVLKSTSQWEKPDSFDPNHFLDKNGCFKNSESFMPFSAGKRKCLGESLARMELFLFLTTLLQNFVFNPVIDHKDINISSVSSGILHIPHVKRPQYGRLPPAPPALPIVGNLFQMDIKAPHKSLIKLSKQYGPVFTLWFGGTPVVVLCGFETLKEGLIERGYDFSGRYLLPILKKISDGYGIAFSNGERWKQLRRFSLSTLKNFGMGKRSIEERIQEEAQCLVTAIRNKQELPFNPDFLLRCTVSNIICSIVFGDRFEYEDERFLTLMERTEGISNAFSKPGVQMYNNFPKIMNFLPGSHHKILQNMADLKTFVNQMIQSHRESLQKDFPRDYIDSFLIKMDEEKHKPDSEFIDENLLMSVINLFLAGTETTSTTLQWAIQILVKFPHIQEKIYQEICEVIGSYRRPAIEDRAKMPYTDAVIHEVQRYIDIVPMNIPHMATKDVEFRGYLIPKGTFVITVLSSVLKATSQWETPDSFNPNHFLDENGCFKQSESFMAFSAGKRMCLGASLARMELFLFLTTLLQNFVFNSITDHKDIDISPATSGILVKPHVYKFCAISR